LTGCNKEIIVKKSIISIAALLFFTSCGGGDLDSDSSLPVPVSVTLIKPSSIEEYITATGTIKAIKNASLKSKNTGYYRLSDNPRTGKPFAIGDYVKKNELILYLGNPKLENNIKIKSKKLELETSKLEYEKQRSLYDKGGVTYRELKDAERANIDAEYNYEYAKNQLSALETRAPFEGTIVSLPYYTPGTELESGLEVAGVMNFITLYLELNIPGRDFDRVETGQNVRVTHYTLAEDTLYGKVTQKAPTINSETRSFMTRVLIDNPGLLFKPGMFVKSEITVAGKDSAIVIPKDIIQIKGKGKTVFIVLKGAANERIIETGIENPDSVEVTHGLDFNDRLVVKGFETLKHHSKVKVLR
jgi:RND family efflux transporter MFP subunit